jgi:hypothetical protein
MEQPYHIAKLTLPTPMLCNPLLLKWKHHPVIRSEVW